MRKFFTFLGAIVVSITANAQSAITLSSSNVTGLKAGISHTTNASLTGLVVPKTGANQTWDYSSLTGGATVSNTLQSATSFSSTAVADTSTIELVTKTSAIPTSSVYDVDANGYFYAGSMIQAQQYSLGFLSGNNNDSDYWAAQSYKVRQNLIAFPTTAGNSWSTTTIHSINFLISVKAYSISKASVQKSVHESVTDTVAGWGTLRVPSSDKSSIAYNVLMIKQHTISVDSSYLNGFPAPVQLLTAFGTKQNDTLVNTYNEYFYREGTGKPLLKISFGSDATYTTPTSASYDADNVESGINNQGYDPAIFNIFPNPASAGPVNIQVNKLSENPWNLTIVNMLGQTVNSIRIEGSGNRDLQLNMAGCKAGLYFAHVTDDKGNLLMSTKLEISK